MIVWEPGKPHYSLQCGKEISTVDVKGEERFRTLNQAFVEAVMGEAPSTVTVEEAIQATAVADACYAAVETGRIAEVEQVDRNHA